MTKPFRYWIYVVIFLSGFSIQAQGAKDAFNLLFIHHSVGNAWLKTNDGDLRITLENPNLNNYIFEVHDATYGDVIGQDTDVCDWYPKFNTMMNLVLKFDYHPNNYYTLPEESNRIVMFKSCYPASDISSIGTPPGDPISTTKSLWNYKAAYLECSKIFSKHPNVLFVVVTAPPLNRNASTYAPQDGRRAWEFNLWLQNEFLDTYTKQTGLKNIAVFDLFGSVLALPENHASWPGALKDIYSKGGSDSHPNKAGNQAATSQFVPFINNAVKEWRSFFGEKNTLSISRPDKADLNLHCGVNHGLRNYAILGSISGVEPGILVNNLLLPLNFDQFTQWTYSLANQPVFPNFQGQLDVEGKAMASIVSSTPLGPNALGVTLHFAYLLTNPVDMISPTVGITFVP